MRASHIDVFKSDKIKKVRIIIKIKKGKGKIPRLILRGNY